MISQPAKSNFHPWNPSQSLERILNARQLGLKFIANVTYGYTSASFSGRMPAVEIADSIVQTGRETLEKVSVTHIFVGILLMKLQAIALINETKKWGARVCPDLFCQSQPMKSLRNRLSMAILIACSCKLRLPLPKTYSKASVVICEVEQKIRHSGSDRTLRIQSL